MSLRQIELPGLPERPLRPRSDGLTLALDKGLSARQAEDFMDVASEFVDFVKLGWGTAVITPNLRRKLDRKSTRLNSSHVAISYAVFCLTKKRSVCSLRIWSLS